MGRSADQYPYRTANHEPKSMHVIGILGGVASGKSLVARQFIELGAGLLDADRTGHEVLEMVDVKEAVHQRWGDRVFGPDGRIDRSRLAAMVFGPGEQVTEDLKYLEQQTHPEIGRRLRQEAERMADADMRAAVLDAPLLLEAGWGDFCHSLVFVDAPRALRLERAFKRGWTEQQFDARQGVQWSLERKRACAETIFDNSGTSEETRNQVVRFWHERID